MDDRKEILALHLKWAVVAVAVVLVAPFVFLLIQGIVGLAVAALLGAAAIAAAPVVGRKLANWRLKGLKQEARANPIETRQNMAMEARERIRRAGEELTAFSAEVKGFADQVRDLHKTQPDDAADFDEQLKGLQRLLGLKQQGLAEAVTKADEFEAATERAARKWKVAQSALRMQKLTGSMADSAMDKLLAAESLDSVQTAMNRALSELDTVLAMSAPPALTNNPSAVITIDVAARERLGVR